MDISKYICLLGIVWILPFSASSRLAAAVPATDDIRIATYLPFLKDNQWNTGCLLSLQQDSLEYKAIQITGYRRENDSTEVLLFRRSHKGPALMKRGVHNIDLPLDLSVPGDFISEIYKDEAFKKCGLDFPGIYRLSVSILSDSFRLEKDFYFEVAQEISRNSNLGKELADLLNSGSDRSGATGRAFLNGKRSGLKKIDNRYGLTHTVQVKDGSIRLDYYYLNRPLGHFKVLAATTLTGQLSDRYEELKKEIRGNGLHLNSLVSEFKKLNSRDNEDRVLSGNINIASFAGNEKDELSGMDDQYMEVQGDISLPVWGIPVQVSGYYTTQDIGRTVKSSFINFKYDHNAAKEKAEKMLSAFRESYSASQSQLQAYEMSYGSFLSSAQEGSGKLYAALDKEYGRGILDQYQAGSKEVVIEMIKRNLEERAGDRDTANLAGRAEEVYARLEEQYGKYQELSRKAAEYRSKLEQLQDNLNIDSAMVMGKLRELDSYKEWNNKDLLRAGTELLPDGKAKSFLGGLTNLEGGIFNKYVSRYTLAGQTIKGLNVGYDIGFAELEGTYGNTEYIDRLGNIEQYKTISVRAGSKTILNQKLSLGYNTITPGRNIVTDEHFVNYGNGILPSFLNAVNIYALQHAGTFISNTLSVNIDAAYASVPGQADAAKEKVRFRDRMAILGELMYQVPKTDFMLTGSYENVGTHFTNHALPVSLSGMQKINGRLSGTVLNAKLWVAVEYNHLLQNNLYARGQQSRYGFEVKTSFRRMPNISLAYKPFTAVRDPYDTFMIRQKETIGDLLTGRLHYQYKTKDNQVFRTSLIWNRSRSYIDTSDFQNTLVQGTFSWNATRWGLLANWGYSHYESSHFETRYPVYNKMTFMSAQFQYKISAAVQSGIGCELAHTRLGISRTGLNAAVAYQVKRVPLSIRISGRYSKYIVEEQLPLKEIFGAGLDISYRLFEKLN